MRALSASKRTATARLKSDERITPAANGAVNWVVVRGAAQNNLKNIDVHIPLGRFVCVTGVSGSGKSSLVNDIIREQLARDLNAAEKTNPGKHREILGKEHLDKVIDIDQSPIGRTPRSNPATYIKLFDEIRDLYAELPDSKVRGYKPGRFSFNVAAVGERVLPSRSGDENGQDAPRRGKSNGAAGGRCEACEGNGATRVEMDFLADVWVTCPICEGRRFNRETLMVRFKGKTIADVLEMDVQQAMEHFANIPQIFSKLKTLHDVGLDYLKLGQPSNTLSGGEAQRIKLARELVKRATGRTLYLLDEPTTGLHFEDVRRLLAVLHGFVDAGNTVIVIEHHLDVVKTADWVIDLGPDGGEGGGYLVAEGTPEDVAACDASHTGQSLREVLRTSRPVSPAKKRASRAAAVSRGAPVSVMRVVGAREHNLRDITVDVPRNAITVCTGVSGSGKSSFAIDTVYTEGHRRYVESLSAYARQFLGQLQKPQVDHVYGLAPAIAIEQKSASKSPRSTVGTVTEIYDYMRVLWARIGEPYCPRCKVAIGSQTADEIVEKVLSLPGGARVMLCAPIERIGAETYAQSLQRMRASGYARVRVDGRVHPLDENVAIDDRRRHVVQVVVDRVIVRADQRSRISDSVEQCLSLGRGGMVAFVLSDEAQDSSAGREIRYSQHFSCDSCGRGFEELTPHHFSFNARIGWCPACEGLAVQRGTNVDSVVLQPGRSVLDGALAGFEKLDKRQLLRSMIAALASHIGFDPKTPWRDLTDPQQHQLLFGTGDAWIASPSFRFQFKGFFPAIDEATRVSWQYRFRLENLVTEVPCETCKGGRLRSEPAAVRLNGRTIHEVCCLPLDAAHRFFTTLPLDRRQKRIAGEMMREITQRLRFLLDVGLEYLTLARPAPTLSGGEAQRIRLASQIGSGLTGVLYVLDEPTIGLHPRDNARLIGALRRLRELGNTLLLVEHDREVISTADHVLDFGPGAGREGGRLVGDAPPRKLSTAPESLTGRYLANQEAIPVPTNRRTGNATAAESKPRKRPTRTPTLFDDSEGDSCAESAPRAITIVGARQNNLKAIDAAFPLNRFICVTGVSGSGKSSLVSEILGPALAQRIHRAALTPGAHSEIRGLEHLDKVINVDQSPIGNSPLSNPATYTGVFDLIRELFARLPDSKVRGYTANRFSFNRAGGRCDACEGLGQVCHEMHFLPDVWVTCEACDGSRYNRETLDIRYKARSISDVLNLSVAEALALFDAIPRIKRMLQTLADVGLGYVALGQAATTLSGGEAQRVKLAAELGRPNTGRTIYILDEPTTGLHMHDVRKLLDVLHRFVDLGNTVVCIEHNLDVIKTADWIIDLGPEAGDGGGCIVVEGTPEQVARVGESHTGRALAPVLAAGPHRERIAYDPRAAYKAAIEMASAAPLEMADATSKQMPWERDGQRWHTQDRPSRNGEKVEWEGAALEHVIKTVERCAAGRLATSWNDRACVEVRAASATTGAPWFMHALTGGRWLLEISFRVPRATFELGRLIGQLGLKTLDQRKDLPIYGDDPRVYLRPVAGDLDNVRVLVHDKAEANTRGFQQFLETAVKAYLARIGELTSDDDAARPWERDGRSWHLGQKAMPPGEAAAWNQTTLFTLLGQMSRALPSLKPDWSRKTHIGLVLPDSREIGRIYTNSRQGLRVALSAPPGAIAMTHLAGLGRDPDIRRGGESSPDEICFCITTGDAFEAAALATIVKSCAAGKPDKAAREIGA